MTSSRPYLLRAMHEWISDNGETPLVVVDAGYPDAQVPEEHIKDGSIVLNVALSATRNLLMDNDGVSFDARFGGVPRAVYFPVEALLGIYSRESGQGMQFERQQEAEAAEESAAEPVAEGLPQEPDDAGPNNAPTRPNGPNLRIVK